MSELLKIHSDRSKDFDYLYKIVTLNLESHINSQTNISVEIKDWIKNLIKGFNTKYKNWIPEQEEYLNILYGQHKNISFDLASLVFLHISYDLALTVAENFKNNTTLKEACIMEKHFIDLEKSLRDSIPRISERYSLIQNVREWYSFIIKIFIRDKTPVNIFMLWIINLRSKAWSNAKTIYVSECSEEKKKELLKKVTEALNYTIKKQKEYSFLKREKSILEFSPLVLEVDSNGLELNFSVMFPVIIIALLTIGIFKLPIDFSKAIDIGSGSNYNNSVNEIFFSGTVLVIAFLLFIAKVARDRKKTKDLQIFLDSYLKTEIEL